MQVTPATSSRIPSARTRHPSPRPTWALQQKGRGWFLVWTVPSALRHLPLFGGRRLYTKTLQTADLREAQYRRDAIVRQFLQLHGAQGTLAAQEAAPSPFDHFLTGLTRDVQKAAGLLSLYPPAPSPAPSHVPAHVGEAPATPARRKATPKGSTGQGITLAEASAAFIKAEKERQANGLKAATSATLSRAKHAAASLGSRLGEKVALRDVERRDVSLWVAALEGQKSDSTREGYIAALSSVWEYCYRGRLVDGENPFRSVGLKSTGDRQSYEPFTVGELAAITDKASPALRPLIKFGLVTGCRIGEIVGLREDDFEVSQGVHLVRIKAGKTANAIRALPLPAGLWQELRGCVASRVWFSRKGKTEAATWSHRFGVLKEEATGQRDRRTGFHSLRGMAITAYQRAGVPEDVTAPLVGHGVKGLTLSYGLYSAGHDYAQQLAAVKDMLESPYMQGFLRLL